MAGPRWVRSGGSRSVCGGVANRDRDPFVSRSALLTILLKRAVTSPTSARVRGAARVPQFGYRLLSGRKIESVLAALWGLAIGPRRAGQVVGQGLAVIGVGVIALGVTVLLLLVVVG